MHAAKHSKSPATTQQETFSANEMDSLQMDGSFLLVNGDLYLWFRDI